ncbi:MAG: hypothetical protein HFH08_00800 [Bacilli bacterium]|nr:hypothetical protein [Bacilli bacterium]
MKNVISTPFGNFEVKQNNKPLEFNCIIKNYSSNKSPALIRLYVVEVETKGQDSLICGFEKPIFEKLSKDEHSTTLFVENDTLVLGLCSLNPNKQTYIMTTNDEYGFTYKTENKITLILCCIEKDKFKDAKKVIEKAIKSEIEATMNIKIKKEKKQSKPIATIFLFGLLSLIYAIFAFLLMKYKIVSNETLKKIGIGILGVLLTSFALANLSGSKEQRKMKKTKTTFLISLLLLIMILISIGLTLYIILIRTGVVKNEMILGIGLMIISLVILCWFVSEYKIEKKAYDEILKKKETKESINVGEKTKQIHPNLLYLTNMFPKKLKNDCINLISKFQIENIKMSELTTTYQLTRETVTIPYRIEIIEQEVENLNETEKILLYCIYTRHYDGHIREKYIKKLLEIELYEWEFPFLLQLSQEYVYEIVEVIYNELKKGKNVKLKEFAKNNKELMCKGYSKMLEYWNRFYRNKCLNLHNYVGRKLFYECFGYSRKYEKKRYQCACCQNKTIIGYFIHYYNEPCPVCHWQNNIIQNNDPNKEGINQVTLKEAQENYQKFGAIKEEYVSLVREPTEKEKVKMNVEQIIKLIKMTLIKEGMTRNKKGLYEYQKQYFKISYCENNILIEKAKNKTDIEKNIWELVEKVKVEFDYKLLIEKIVSIIKACEKKKSKKLSKAEKDKIVEEEINRWNPLGLIKDEKANGEYQLEIKKVTTKLSKLKTEIELKEHIEQVFQQLFGENLFMNKKKEVEEVAKLVWERMNQK